MATGARNIIAVSYIPEAAYGTAKTDKLMAFPYTGELPGLDPKFEFLKDHIFGKLGQVAGELVELDGAWNPSMVLNPSNAAVFLRYALGSISKATHSGETTVFDHTLSEIATDTPSSTLVTSTDIGKLQFPGAKLMGLEISGRSGQFWRVTPTWNLQGVQASSAATMPAIKNEDNFTFANASLTLGGVDISSGVAGFDMRINLEADPANEGQMGQLYKAGLEHSQRIVTGQILRRYTADTTINQIIAANQASQALVLTLTGKNIAGSVVPTPYSIAITIPAIILTTPRVTGGRGKLMHPISWEALYDTATSKNISAVVVSDTDYTT